MATGNLLFDAQNFTSPDIVQRLSQFLGESFDKTKAGLNSAVPAILKGLVDKGATLDGAQSLINIIQKDGVTQAPAQATIKDEKTMEKGLDALGGIFGPNLDPVVNKIGSSSGMSTASITRLLGSITPFVIGLLKGHTSSNATALKQFLDTQRTSFPTHIEEVPRARARTRVRSVERTRSVSRYRFPWLAMALLALAILSGVWWFSSKEAAEIMQADETVTTTAAPQRTMTSASPEVINATVAAPLTELEPFLAAGVIDELPKRFLLSDVAFATSSSVLMSGSEGELDRLAQVLNLHPGAKVRLEGFTDNTGDELFNQDLSGLRAEVIKSELMERGVSGDRMEIAGMGSTNPIASNNTAEGRGQNSRIELVITSFNR